MRRKKCELPETPETRRERLHALYDKNAEKKYRGGREHLTWRSIYGDGICYLCGEPVDPANCAWINGAFVTGWRYPTLDHVVPILRGGKHEADNVRLAHKWCNTVKRNHTADEVLCRGDYLAAFRKKPKDKWEAF